MLGEDESIFPFYLNLHICLIHIFAIDLGMDKYEDEFSVLLKFFLKQHNILEVFECL